MEKVTLILSPIKYFFILLLSFIHFGFELQNKKLKKTKNTKFENTVGTKNVSLC